MDGFAVNGDLRRRSSRRLRETTPAAVVPSPTSRNGLQQVLEVSDSIMGWNHVLDHNYIPWIFFIRSGFLYRDLVTYCTEVSRKLLSRAFIGEYDCEVDIFVAESKSSPCSAMRRSTSRSALSGKSTNPLLSLKTPHRIIERCPAKLRCRLPGPSATSAITSAQNGCTKFSPWDAKC